MEIYGDAEICSNAVICGDTIICGDAQVKSEKDYITFKNNWSDRRYFTWTKSNNMWRDGTLYGTGEELIKKGYEDSEESGKKYEAYVNLIKELNSI